MWQQWPGTRSTVQIFERGFGPRTRSNSRGSPSRSLSTGEQQKIEQLVRDAARCSGSCYDGVDMTAAKGQSHVLRFGFYEIWLPLEQWKRMFFRTPSTRSTQRCSRAFTDSKVYFQPAKADKEYPHSVRCSSTHSTKYGSGVRIFFATHRRIGEPFRIACASREPGRRTASSTCPYLIT